MRLHRSDPKYQALQLAWTLTQSPAWKDYLLPLLTSKVHRQPSNKLRTLEDITTRIAEEEKADTYKTIINQIQRDAEKYLSVIPE